MVRMCTCFTFAGHRKPQAAPKACCACHNACPHALQVPHVLHELLTQLGLQSLPVYALGASSGGAFALVLAQHFPLAGVCSQVMALPLHLLQLGLEHHSSGGSSAPGAPPPHMYVHMVRDVRTAALVHENVELLRQRVSGLGAPAGWRGLDDRTGALSSEALGLPCAVLARRARDA